MKSKKIMLLELQDQLDAAREVGRWDLVELFQSAALRMGLTEKETTK